MMMMMMTTTKTTTTIQHHVKRKMYRSSDVPLQAGFPHPAGYRLVLRQQTRHIRILHVETQSNSHLFYVLLPCLSACSPKTYSTPYHHAHPRATETKKNLAVCTTRSKINVEFTLVWQGDARRWLVMLPNQGVSPTCSPTY